MAGLRPEYGGDQDKHKGTQQRGHRNGPGFECGLEAAGPASHGIGSVEGKPKAGGRGESRVGLGLSLGPPIEEWSQGLC